MTGTQVIQTVFRYLLDRGKGMTYMTDPPFETCFTRCSHTYLSIL